MNILPIFIPHLGCPFNCVYCDQHLITKTIHINPKEIANRIENFCGKNIALKDKEIAFFGGTFTNLPIKKQQELFDLTKPFLTKISGIRISTRPDFINDKILGFCKANQVKVIELGIQSFSDDVLSASKRGYNAKTAISVCNLIKTHNFKLGIQLMPGLPDFSEKSIIETVKTTIHIQPDFVRIYPTIVLKKTVLEKWYKKQKYIPLTIEKAIEIVSEMKLLFDKNNIKIIKIGLHSDIDINSIVAGPYHPAFGELVNSNILLIKIIKEYKKSSTLIISAKDVSLFKGFDSRMLSKLKEKLKLDKIPVIINSNLIKNNFYWRKISPEKFW